MIPFSAVTGSSPYFIAGNNKIADLCYNTGLLVRWCLAELEMRYEGRANVYLEKINV